MTIAEASRVMNLPYENTKAIYRVYKSEGRLKKLLYADQNRKNLRKRDEKAN